MTDHLPAVRRLPKGARTIMASRVESSRARDDFPTPPWATRALMERVLPHALGHDWAPSFLTAWEPACGRGVMADVLREYFRFVQASDLYTYGHSHSGWNFITKGAPETYDWIITNPPFGRKTTPFILRALDLARIGVAMFLRLQSLETIERHERIFKPYPPTLVAFFVERVNLCKGRWAPNGSTATAYVWVVWVKGRSPMAPFWIPPGQRRVLTKSDDRARFAAWSMPKAEAAE